MEKLLETVAKALGVDKIDNDTDLSQLTIIHNNALNEKIAQERNAGQSAYEKEFLKAKNAKHKSIEDYIAESVGSAKAAALEELKKTPDERVTKLQAELDAQIKRALAIEKERDEARNGFESYKSTQTARTVFEKLADESGFANDKDSAFMLFNAMYKVSGEAVTDLDGNTMKKPNGLPVAPKDFFEAWAAKVYPAGWKKDNGQKPAGGRGAVDSKTGAPAESEFQKMKEDFYAKNPGASKADYQRFLVNHYKSKNNK